MAPKTESPLAVSSESLPEVASRLRLAVMRLSRLVRETLEKLPFPEDVTVTVDVDPYQLL